MDWKLVLHILFTNAILFIVISIIRLLKNAINRPKDNLNIEFKVGDKIVFAAGLIGTIKEIHEESDTITVEIADDVLVDSSKYSVIEIIS